MKFIVVTGGVISGVGKGITSSSIAKLLQSRGIVVTMIKIDPYLNFDAGLMSPFEHGECFVLADGGESDLDLGNYERFLNVNLTKDHNITTGKIYHRVINNERQGLYLGATVQIVPHLTDCIISHIENTSLLPISGKIPEVCVIEIGGTIGDIEVLPFVEALQQMQSNENHSFCFIHVGMIIENPEPKTKPIQNSVSVLRSRGIVPNMLVVRSTKPIDLEIKQKLHKMCSIKLSNIISNPNVPSIYHVPKEFESQNLSSSILSILNINSRATATVPYLDYITQCNKPIISIGIIGKYCNSPDTYISIQRALEHACGTRFQAEIFFFNTDYWSDDHEVEGLIREMDAIIVPGGFGSRGILGKTLVLNHARENNIPTLGICLGMQIMVVSAVNQIGVKVTSREWDTTNSEIQYIVDVMSGMDDVHGESMRLGNYTTTLYPGLVQDLYRSKEIIERHRHRYEVKIEHADLIESAGLTICGVNSDNSLIEVVADSNQDFFVGCQYHPEYSSRLENPHPLFVGLISAAAKQTYNL